jgi:hypothetical protein
MIVCTKRSQTGASFDQTSLTKGGSREMKKIMYLVAWTLSRMMLDKGGQSS